MENKTNINGIVFLRSYYEAVKDLEQDDQLEMYNAIFSLVFEGIAPTFTKKYLNSIYKVIEPNLAGSINRYQTSVENGKKGGRKPNKTVMSDLIQTQVSTSKEEKVKPETSNKEKNGVYNKQSIINFINLKVDGGTISKSNGKYLIDRIESGEELSKEEINEEIKFYI